MVLQTTEADEEAERFVRRQASLSSAREVEGLSAPAEPRAAQLKDDTPVGIKRRTPCPQSAPVRPSVHRRCQALPKP